MSGKRVSTSAGALQGSGSSGDELTFKGVIYREREQEHFEAALCLSGTRTSLGFFYTAEKAARAYDNAARKAGRRVVNFPRLGMNEVQAVKGEREEVTLRRADGEVPPRSGPLPPDPGYKGVHVNLDARTAAVFHACITLPGKTTISLCKTTISLGNFCNAEEAARAYDDAVRKTGRRVVNFPRPGTNEVQAVKGEKDEVTLQRAAGKRLPPRSGPFPPDPGFKGVCVNADAGTAAVFEARFTYAGGTIRLDNFCTAEEAARAYDDAARNVGRRVVNFPRPGTDEVQAVKGEKDELTLMRHAAEQAAGEAGAAAGITSHGKAASPTKRHAAAPPPSQPLRKRAAASAEMHAPAAVKPELPAAPPPAPYTRRPPHRIDTAARPPPDEALGAASGVKTEPPVAPTVAGLASPAPPPASLKAPGVKHEDTTAAAPAPAVKLEDLLVS